MVLKVAALRSKLSRPLIAAMATRSAKSRSRERTTGLVPATAAGGGAEPFRQNRRGLRLAHPDRGGPDHSRPSHRGAGAPASRLGRAGRTLLPAARAARWWRGHVVLVSGRMNAEG